MKNLRYLVLLVIIFSSCNGVKNNSGKGGLNTLSPAEKNEGWQLLFDGKSMAGWHSYGKKSSGNGWSIRNNALFLDPAKKDTGNQVHEDLVTADEYDNFALKLDWKIAPNGNSGIIFFIKEDAVKYPAPWVTGLEMQVIDNEGHADAKFPKHRAGDLYDLISVSKENVKPVGQWNSIEIRSNRGKLDFFMNGEHVVNTTLWNDTWKTMVGNSKFKDYSDFGTMKAGRIALQDHGDAVWYRNIKIRRL